MAKTKSLLITLCLLLFFCSARQLPPRHQSESCQLDSIDALEPDNSIESEAGLTETWDANHPELRCVGVSVLKRTINPNGLHLPSYVTYPELHFVEQGGVQVNFLVHSLISKALLFGVKYLSHQCTHRNGSIGIGNSRMWRDI